MIPMTQTKRVSQVRGYEHRRSYFEVLVACLLYVNFFRIALEHMLAFFEAKWYLSNELEQSLPQTM